MAIEHLLTMMDTPRSVSLKYFGTESRWEEIMAYNGLDYPYFVQDNAAYNLLYAHGYLTFTRTFFSGELIIYKGSKFTTKPDSYGVRKMYEVTEDTTIPAGQAMGYVFVQCTNYGTFGNTIANSIQEVYNLQTNLGEFIGSVTVTNEQAFVNGMDARVRIAGQPIYIPEPGAESAVTTVTNLDQFLNLLGGEDLALSPDGELIVDEFGDMQTKLGMDNIIQGALHRMQTEMGTLGAHPEYGVNFSSVGKAQTVYTRKQMELYIKEALLYDDRISTVTINNLDLAVKATGTSVSVDVTLEINKTGELVRLSTTLN